MLGKSDQRPKGGRACHASGWMIVALLTVTSGCGLVTTGQNMQGVRLYQQGQLHGAMKKFQHAMATNPDDADAYYNLAVALHQMGKMNNDSKALQQSEQLYNECLNRNPDHTDCHRALAVLLVETDRSDRAFVLLKNWATRAPENPDARVELARLYHEFGDLKTAELQLQQALQLDQANERAWTAMAWLRESNGEYQQALANYQRAYALNGYSPSLANRIAALNNAADTTGTYPAGTRTVDAQAAPVARY
ncbi:MAG: tetratricopeptide repeat protein [Planctomycetota bacterium]